MNVWEAIGNMVKAQGIEFVFGLRTGPESGRHYRGVIVAAGGARSVVNGARRSHRLMKVARW